MVQNDIFSDNAHYDMSNAMDQQRQLMMNDIGFQELEKTAEYMETHYFKEKQIENRTMFSATCTGFFTDYMKWLISEERATSPFLTSSVIPL